MKFLISFLILSFAFNAFANSECKDVFESELKITSGSVHEVITKAKAKGLKDSLTQSLIQKWYEDKSRKGDLLASYSLGKIHEYGLLGERSRSLLYTFYWYVETVGRSKAIDWHQKILGQDGKEVTKKIKALEHFIAQEEQSASEKEALNIVRKALLGDVEALKHIQIIVGPIADQYKEALEALKKVSLTATESKALDIIRKAEKGDVEAKKHIGVLLFLTDKKRRHLVI